MTASRDRGRTWSKPVSATPDDGTIYFQPNLAVDEAGRVAISAFALTNGRMDEVLLLSPAGRLRFRPPLRVTTAPFNPLDQTTASRGKYGIWWLGDWQGIASGTGVSTSSRTTPARGAGPLLRHRAPVERDGSARWPAGVVRAERISAGACRHARQARAPRGIEGR